MSDSFELDYENVSKKVNKITSIEIIIKKVDREKSDKLRAWMQENQHELEVVEEVSVSNIIGLSINEVEKILKRQV